MAPLSLYAYLINHYQTASQSHRCKIASQISFDKFEEIFDLHFILICSVPPIALFLVVYLIFTNIASAKTKICLTSGSIALAIAAIFISYTAYHWELDHYDDNQVDEIGVRLPN